MSKQRAMQFDRELRTVQKNIAENEIKAGRLLKVIKEEELWVHIGHNYSDFDQYCDRVCGYKEGAAQTRICIVNRIDEANIKVKPTHLLSHHKRISFL